MKMVGRVLIVGTHRSGTTNLANALSEILSLEMLQEPWNYYLFNEEENLYPEVIYKYGIIKSLVQQYPKSWKNNNIVDFYADLISKYSNVVLLGRKDRKALAESYFRQMQFGNENWHTEYTLQSTSMLKIDMDFINRYCDILEEISKLVNIPITWYEDLYSGERTKVLKSLENWNFSSNFSTDYFMNFVNPINKYRKSYLL